LIAMDTTDSGAHRHLLYFQTRSGKEATLLPPPPLRTVRATFAAHSSSPEKPRLTRAGQKTFTRLAAAGVHPSVERCRAAPVAQGYFRIHASLCPAPATLA
jgi:hypothetical protein